MKKVALAVAIIGSASINAIAQPTLRSTDINPIVGNTFILTSCDTNVSQMVGGPNRVWNFTSGAGLTEQKTDTVTVIAAATAPYASMFTGSNVATKAFSYVFNDTGVNFFITTPSVYSLNGFYANPNQNAVFTDPIDQFRFPTRYGDAFTDSYSGRINYNYLGLPVSATSRGTATVTVDGWGRLILPTGTYDSVLRVHNWMVFSDSASVFGLPFFIKVNIHTYSWYIKGYHNALMTIGIADDTSGAYHWKYVNFGRLFRLSVQDATMTEANVQTYPNPSSGLLHINISRLNSAVRKMEILDVAGRVEAEIPYSSDKVITYNTSELSKGVHILRLYADGAVLSKQISIE
jgi:hypothetical protein